MAISLQKGQKVNLSKEKGGLTKVLIGLGWDEVKRERKSFFAPKPVPIDCDASALLLQNGKLKDKSDLVYFGNLGHKSGCIQHMGDNLTGAGEGDDEQIVVNLEQLPEVYDRIVIVVNIYQAFQRNQHFGLIQNAFMHLYDGKTNQDLCRFDLTESYAGMTAVIFGEIYRYNGEWKFNAIGQGTKDTSLGELIKRYM